MQVKTGKEPEILNQIKKNTLKNNISISNVYFPRRTLYIRKLGIKKKQITSVFPGYIFLETETLSTELYWLLRKTEGVYRFLPDNHNPLALHSTDLDILHHFLSFGEITQPSKAYFDENDRICITEGPLKGLEGKILKVDKRKQRVKVVLDMYNNVFPIDLAFEFIEPIKLSLQKRKEEPQ